MSFSFWVSTCASSTDEIGVAALRIEPSPLWMERSAQAVRLKVATQVRNPITANCRHSFKSRGMRLPSASMIRLRITAATPTRLSATVKGGKAAVRVLKNRKDEPQHSDRPISSRHSRPPMRS